MRLALRYFKFMTQNSTSPNMAPLSYATVNQLWLAEKLQNKSLGAVGCVVPYVNRLAQRIFARPLFQEIGVGFAIREPLVSMRILMQQLIIIRCLSKPVVQASWGYNGCSDQLS